MDSKYILQPGSIEFILVGTPMTSMDGVHGRNSMHYPTFSGKGDKEYT